MHMMPSGCRLRRRNQNAQIRPVGIVYPVQLNSRHTSVWLIVVLASCLRYPYRVVYSTDGDE